MYTKTIIATSTLLSLALFGIGCKSPIEAAKERAMQKVTDAVTEKVIENSTDGKVKVDLNSGNNTISAIGEDGQRVSFGENIALPSNIAADVPIYPNAKNRASSFDANGKNGGFTQSTGDALEKVSEFMLNKMKDQGFKKSMETTADNVWIAGFKKDNVTISISLSKGDENMTTVIVSRSEQPSGE